MVLVEQPASVNAKGELVIQTDAGAVNIQPGQFTQFQGFYYVDPAALNSLNGLIQQALNYAPTVGAGAAALGASVWILTGGLGDDEDQPSASAQVSGDIDDTGPSGSDGITNDNSVTVDTNASWEYSLDGGQTWLVGSGNSFSVPDGTYSANAIQVRATGQDGVAVTSIVNSSAITVDTTGPSFTTAPASTTVAEDSTGTLITVTATDALGAVTYSLDAASIAAGFSIDASGNITNSAGLDFETTNAFEIQITATDTAGNASTATVNLAVTDVNEAPTASTSTVTMAEDGSYTFSVADFGYADPEGAALSSITITSNPSAGTLLDNGSPITGAPVTLTAAQITTLTFTPAANANGNGYATFSFTVNDGGLESNAAATMSVNVTPANDLPTAADNSITVVEDSAHTFATSDFGFTDIDGDSLASITISAAPGAGTLAVGGVAITIYPATVTAAQIPTLSFTPAANQSGTNYATLSFTVNDGTADSASANTITFNVTAQDDAPTGTDKTVSVNEDASYTFSAADFGYSDPEGAALASITISAEPSAGTLLDNGTPITVFPATLLAADLATLTFSPAADANGNGYTTFSFTVNDGGQNSTTANTITVDVTPQNDDPTAQDKTIVVLEDGSHSFAEVDFGFADIDSDSLNSVKITGFTGSGTLSIGGVAVAAFPATLTAAQIATLTFMPAADASGTGYASFDFTVNDGTADSATANTITVDVTAQNDDPVAVDDSATTAEDTLVTIDVLANDTDVENDTLSISAVGTPSNGSAVINAGKIDYTPNSGYDGADSFTYTVSDGNGGSHTATVNVTVTVTPSSGTPPVITANASYDVEENSTGTLVATTIADATSVTLTGDDSGLFNIDSSGNITANTAGLDWEALDDANKDGVYKLTISATNTSGTTTHDLVINLKDVAEVAAATAYDSGPEYVDAVLANDSGSWWNSHWEGMGNFNTPTNLTWGFNTGLTMGGTGNQLIETSDLVAWTADEMAWIRSVFSEIDRMTNIDFTEDTNITSATARTDTHILLGKADSSDTGYGSSTSVLAFAFQPFGPTPKTQPGNQSSDGSTLLYSSGDIVLHSNKYSATEVAQEDSPFRATFVHELMHALGGDHPFNDAVSGAGFDPYSSTTSTGQNRLGETTGGAHDSPNADNFMESALTYYRAWETGRSTGVTREFEGDQLGVTDIAALQHLYGVNLTDATTSGDNTYTFNSGTKVMHNVWDVGGNDTFEHTGSDVAYIDLNAGKFSRMGTLPSDEIEYTMSYLNGIGISGSAITSVSWQSGHENNGTLTLAADGSKFDVNLNSAEDGFDGSLQLNVVIDGTTGWSFGSTGLNAASIETARNIGIAHGVTIENAKGGDADDTIIGNQTTNQITGGAGNDTLTGNGAGDVFIFNSGDGTDTITDFVQGEDVLHFTGGLTALGSGGVTTNATNSVVDLGSGQTVTLDGYTGGLTQDVDYFFV